MRFLLILILIIILVGYMLPWILRLWLMRMQKRFGMNSGSGSVHQRTDRPKKHIDKQAGEYVDFEEIE